MGNRSGSKSLLICVPNRQTSAVRFAQASLIYKRCRQDGNMFKFNNCSFFPAWTICSTRQTKIHVVRKFNHQIKTTQMSGADTVAKLLCSELNKPRILILLFSLWFMQGLSNTSFHEILQWFLVAWKFWIHLYIAWKILTVCNFSIAPSNRFVPMLLNVWQSLVTNNALQHRCSHLLYDWVDMWQCRVQPTY